MDNVSKSAISEERKPALAGKPWSREELGYLADCFGLKPDEDIAYHLRRSECAIRTTATNRHIKRTDNFYTALEVQKVLGISSSHKVGDCVRWGWLKGQRAPYYRGKHQLWFFTEEDIVQCLRQRPWLVKNVKLMPEHYFRSVVREEWERDPWYTPEEAAQKLEMSPATIYRYLSRGWLASVQNDGYTPPIIRQSAIDAFLKTPELRRNEQQATRRAGALLRLKKLGLPTRESTLWHFECPRCGQEVEILAPSHLGGPQVKEKFIDIYVNGTCEHSAKVEIPTG